MDMTSNVITGINLFLKVKKSPEGGAVDLLARENTNMLMPQITVYGHYSCNYIYIFHHSAVKKPTTASSNSACQHGPHI